MHQRMFSARLSFFIVLSACPFCIPTMTVRAAPAPAPDPGPATVWVFFNDKGYGSAPAERRVIQAFELSLDANAVRRRQMRGIAPDGRVVDRGDLPVAPAYADALASLGASVRVNSAWLGAVSVSATPQQLARINQLPFVDHVQPVAQFSRPSMVPEPIPAPERTVVPAGSGPEAFYGVAASQLEQINIPAVHALGYTGAGVKIGVLDTGFKRTHVAFNNAAHPIQVTAEHDFLENDSDTSDITNDQHQHGTYILGTMGAYQPNVIVGGAYDATFMLAKTEDVSQEVPAEEDYWVAGLEYLENNGADVVTSSLGYIDWYAQNQLDGRTAVTTIAAAAAAARGLPITNAAGNEGHDDDPLTSHLIAPADADLLIAVGAVDELGDAAGFTSDGPTADARVKPELVARGVGTATVPAFSDSGFTFVDGTSLATPLAASAVALLVQAHPDWSVEQIRYALFNTASGSGAFDPLYVRGYGIIDTLAAVQTSFDKVYTSTSSGNWDAGSNWTGATAPIQVSDVIINPPAALTVFGPAVSTRVQSLSIDAQAGVNPAILQLASGASLTIDRTLAIGQRGALTLNVGSLIVNGSTVNNGELNLNRTAHVNDITGTGSTSIGAGGWLFASAIVQDELNLLGNGRATLTSDGSIVKSLALAGGSAPAAKLDLIENSLTIDYSGASSPIATIASQVAFAYHGGLWDRPGITSSAADANAFAVGFGDIGSSKLLICLTHYGDATLDGVVNLDDFNALASNFGLSGKLWSEGNFNFDALGTVDLDDFNLLAGNFGLSAGPDGILDPGDWAALASAVPEPGSSLIAAAGLAASAAICARRRPKRAK